MLNAFKRGRIGVSLIAGVAAIAVAPAAASAETIVIGQKVKGPGKACENNRRASNDNVTVCFRSKGEWLYVKDGAKDGRSAYGQISGRDRRCRNPYGAGTWVRCNYSFREGSVVVFRGYTRDNEGRINLTRNETLYETALA